MITELIPLLNTHTISFKLEVTGDDFIVYVMPTLKKESQPKLEHGGAVEARELEEATEGDAQVLEQNLTRRFKLSEFDEATLTNELLNYSNTMVDGTTQILEVSEAIKKRIEDKIKADKEKQNKKKPAAKKPAPKRKTKAQKEAEEREAARAKQEEERKNVEPPKEEDRLAPKEETGTKQPKIVDKLNEKTEQAMKDDDPLGLGLGDLDL
tara:strand:+ start:78 stop:707 length:630 start_codon:yes stop_codon:yes gene_type:complete